MDVLGSEGFYVPLVLHTIREGEQAFLHCTSSVMLQIPGLYKARPPPPHHHRGASLLSAATEPIADCCSEERGEVGFQIHSLHHQADRMR